MAKLAISQLKPGMVTNSEVVDQHGHTLIHTNESISESHITLLKMWGIYEIDIKDAACVLNLDHLKIKYPAQLVDSLIEESQLKYKNLEQNSRLAHFLKKTYVEYSVKGSV